MSLRLLTSGLVLVVASGFSCENQGRGVGTDVVDQLCELNREAVATLHSKDGIAKENDAFFYLYCDNSTDANGDGIADQAEKQGSCKELQPDDVDNIVADCQRNGARAQSRCLSEMQAMLDCLKAELERADSRADFFTSQFNCWTDTNGNGVYDGGVYWTWPEDGSRPDADLNHPETCVSTNDDENIPTVGDTGTHLSCGQTPALDANGNPKLDTTGKPMTKPSRCYFMKELPRKGDETIRYNNVVFALQPTTDPLTHRSVQTPGVCSVEYLALNKCTKESAEFLRAPTEALGVAGAAGTTAR